MLSEHSAGNIEPFADETGGEPAVRGFLHYPSISRNSGLVLTHGAGADCESRLLVALAIAFADAGFTVLRCDLPFRQVRRHGPPFRASAVSDRAGLRHAVFALKRLVAGGIFLGGHSYGGRQASILTADEPELTQGLLLLSYPLHPPKRPDELRTAHFPRLHTAAVFVHGSRDPFASIGEMDSALKLIPSRTVLMPVEGAGHDLLRRGRSRQAPEELASEVATEFLKFMD